MSICCDKNCDTSSTVLIIIILLSLITSYLCPVKFVKVMCLILTIILLITLVITQSGGYEQFLQNSDDSKKIEYLKGLLKNVVPKCYLDDIPVYSSSSESYTFKKKKIFLCIKDFDVNSIIYVLLHEYAHCMTPPEPDAHSAVWRKNFDDLLKKAEEQGVYNPNIPFDENYMKMCGSGK